MKCKYGCEQEATTQQKNGDWICSESANQCPVNKKKNSDKIKLAHSEGRIPGWKDLPNLNRGWSKGKNVFNDSRIKSKEGKDNIFIENSTFARGYVKKIIIQEKLLDFTKCRKCGLSEWMGEKIPLELEHIDGKNTNHTLSNLEFLCPNCHSQTNTYKGRNINNGKSKITDEEFKNAILQKKNIRQALLSLGLAPCLTYYKKAYKIIGESQ